MAKLKPIIRTAPSRLGPLKATITIEFPELTLTRPQLEALGFRSLGEQAEQIEEFESAIDHYARAVALWPAVGCKRRLAHLRKVHGGVTVYRRKRPNGSRDRVFSYEFVYRARTYRGTTGQIAKDPALAVERQLKDKLRQQAHGVAIATSADTPTIQDWAETYFAIKSRRLTDPASLEYVLRGVLKFFGQKPGPTSAIPVDPDAPYHDLTLGAILERPRWIGEFDDWLYARKLSEQTRNHYRSAMSDMYRVASEHQYRELTGVLSNPFAGIARDRVTRRTATLTPAQLQAWIANASAHARYAVAIGALASKLRLRNILALEWRQISPDYRTMTIERHKTVSRIGRPLVVAISDPLAIILKTLRSENPKATHVITYRGKPMKSIKNALEQAATRAGLIYGRTAPQGVTFHTLRHTAATLLALARVPADVRQAVMGHASLAMTQWYEHLDVEQERPAVQQLAAALAITPEAVFAPRRVKPKARTTAPKSTPSSGLKSTPRKRRAS
jgi:integrase